MSTRQFASATNDPASDGISQAELHLGKVLALIHRVLPKLDDPTRAAEVQTALRAAVNAVESARSAHAGQFASSKQAPASAQHVATAVEPEIAAIIAAAVSVLFDSRYRLVSVHQVTTPVPHLNVWALEGRTQIFQSHKIR